jgi:hypothetical protein
MLFVGVFWRLTAQEPRAARGVAAEAILGKWKHANGLDTLEFTPGGTYSIRNQQGQVGKAGKYRVIDGNAMEWEHTTRFRKDAVVLPGQRGQPTGMTELVRVRIELSGDELVISSGSGSSRWHR